jgi:putative sterol carrier protein
LTEEWATKLSEAASADEEMRAATKGHQLVLQMNLSDHPSVPVFAVRFDDGTTKFELGDPGSSDVQCAVTYETMCQLSTGELAGQTAGMTGKMKITGDMMQMVSVGQALDHLPRLNKQIGVEF